MAELALLRPDWPAPVSVQVVTTTRSGGVSAPPFDSLNLATHVGDDPGAVRENRRRLREALQLPAEPLWLQQVHGVRVARHDGRGTLAADASVAFQPGEVCAVLTADCLPVVFADRSGTRVGVSHAGWRGLAEGVLETTIAALASDPAQLLAWLGPAIGPAAFEVGPEVRERFVTHATEAAGAFVRGRGDRWQADLYALARQRLLAAGVGWVGGGGECTWSEAMRFFSYRRSTRCGRMATLAWLSPAGTY